MRGTRGRQRGSATVELVAGLPLLGFCIALGWQGLVLARQTAEADADARAAARQLVACGAREPDWTAIDANTDASRYSVMRTRDAVGGALTTVTVTLPSFSLLPVFGTARLGVVTPTGQVTMRQEPC